MVSMNRLSTEKRAGIVASLVEGNSIRATVRMTGAAKNTITKLLVDLGQASSEYQDRTLRNLPCKRIECDEIWAFVGAKAKNVRPDHPQDYGDVWTWTALCADTKLVPSWLVGERHAIDAYVFMTDLASRLAHRIQLTTDGNRVYLEAVAEAFGADIDYAMLQKLYGNPPREREASRRYSPSDCIGVEVHPIMGDPHPAHISTSYVERQNLTMRMGMRRFTLLGEGVGQPVENLAHAVSLHYMHYNFARVHKSLSKPYPTTPAMAAGAADHVWAAREIAALLD
jgi:hypothetical protein